MPPCEGPRGRRPVVIIAEDSEVSAKMLTKLVMEAADCEVVRARDGDEAFEAIRENIGLVCCALMDVNMPRCDGLEATRQIRFWETSSKGRGARVPIIGLTASGGDNVEQQCIDAGMSCFMTKPIQAEDIRQLLRRYSYSMSSL